MLSWLFFFIIVLAIILMLVLPQIWLTRRAMAKFAARHGMTYKKPRWPFFDVGEIHGKANGATFFMGMMTRAMEKLLYMRVTVEGMPQKLVIRRHGPKIAEEMEKAFLKINETLSHKKVIPALKTGDEGFDSRFDVIGPQEEVLPWLTTRRREAIASLLSKENYGVAEGGLEYCITRTYMSLAAMEEVFANLMTAHGELQRMP